MTLAPTSTKTEIERFIEEFESKIISLESEISALIKLRDSQRACVLALRYIASPIHTLPVELLAEIFDFAIEDETHIEDAHGISQVCSDWRQVAHSTPRLWTRTLEVDLCEQADVADGWKAWLARSAPMRIPMYFMGDFENINPGILEEVLSVAPRWSSLRLDSTCRTPPSLVRQLAHCRLDSLEDLDLGFIRETDPAQPPPFTVPRLRKLSIINHTEDTLQIVVPWVQLTELAFECNSPDTTLEILTQCLNLIAANITISRWYQSPKVISIHLNQLQSLYLSVDDEFAPIAAFLDCLSTPELQTLQLQLDSPQPQAHFTAFQLRAPNITRLEFTNSLLFTSDDLTAAMRNAPSLTHLHLDCCSKCFDDASIRSLYHKDGVAPLAPHLHSLVVKTHIVNLTDEVLAGMIVSRWCTDIELASYAIPPAVARWTHVKLEFYLRFRRYYLGPHFTDIVKDIPSNILIYSRTVE
ncbi:hypothetical protein C8R45DRAFT_1172581 [Mycena sanguinolenta]|nr:hypothetical protein C8R45DRAFT_1172581 [Mycena sanguinolenta]